MALLMIEVQMATNGPLDELMNAFRNMLQDLKWKISIENQDYSEKSTTHRMIETEILDRKKSAEYDVGVSTHKLDQVWYPERAALEQYIVDDGALIEATYAKID